MMRPHRYSEGERVALRENRPELAIHAGDPGVVEVLYPAEPPLYEVTFRCRDGQSFGMVCREHELMNLEQSDPEQM